VIDRSLKKDAKAAKTLLQQMINIIRYRREVRQGIELLGGPIKELEWEKKKKKKKKMKKKKKKKN
jgi:hypothetical protein